MNGALLTLTPCGLVDVGRLAAGFPAPQGGLGVASLMGALLVATFVSEDLTCISAGLLVTHGTLGFLPATLACLVGIVVGDILLYTAGRYLGRPLLHRAPLRWFINREDVERSTAWFRHNGPLIVLTSRFLPGSRLPTFVAAGALRMPLGLFAVLFLAAACLWTPILVGLSMRLGIWMHEAFAVYRGLALPAAAATVVAMWLLLHWGIPLFSYRGRRLLVSAWRRKVRWEFWPPWVFYPPMLLYVLYLGIRHRRLTAFTAANPAMPDGGFIGESKTDILDALQPPVAHLARYRRIPPGADPERRAGQVEAFMAEHGLAFPIVLKPDVGERGRGVSVIRGSDGVAAYFRDTPGDVMVQEYAPGHEFGVFYYRYPHERTGHILSITDKQFPSVTGDGRRTLETLILADDRAVCQARTYFRLHGERLYDVPADGETIRLVELGTHCRGAMFLDGRELLTPALEEAVDSLSRPYQGFFFGRYDLRTPSIPDFKSGRNFKVIELNGVTSEATHIYDPATPLRDAYRTLMNQWRIAFEIGAENMRSGAHTTPLHALLRSIFDHRT